MWIAYSIVSSFRLGKIIGFVPRSNLLDRIEIFVYFFRQSKIEAAEHAYK